MLCVNTFSDQVSRLYCTHFKKSPFSHVSPTGIIVAKTVLATQLLLAVWKISKAKATIRVPLAAIETQNAVHQQGSFSFLELFHLDHYYLAIVNGENNVSSCSGAHYVLNHMFFLENPAWRQSNSSLKLRYIETHF